jgi:hypothetical protein
MIRQVCRCVVVVAAHGDRAALDEVHHGLNRPFRIGAIADVVAEADDPVRACAAPPSRQALNACRLAWISAKTARRTLPPRP